MFRKLILLSAAVLLLFNGIGSSVAETESGGTDTVVENAYAKSLTLEEAYTLALENNIDLKKAALDFDSAIIEAEQADYNADAIGESITSLQQAQTKYVNKKQKDLAEELAEQEYNIAKDRTKIVVEENYHNVLKTANMVTVKEAALKRTQEQLALTQKKFRAGSAIKTNVNQAEISLANAESDLANAQRDHKNAQVALNRSIGLDMDTDIKPVKVLKYEKIELPSIETLTKEALEKRLDLQRSRNSLTIAQMSYDFIVGYEAPNTFSARKSKVSLEKAKLDVLQVEQNVRADVSSTLFQLQKADQVVHSQAKGLKQAKDNYNLTKRRYEIGVGSYVDVLSASVDLADAEARYIEAVYNHSQAKNKLETVTLVSN